MRSNLASRAGRPSTEDTVQKISQVLKSALHLFCGLGYRAVRMRDVAEMANVSTRTIYNHYPDKQALFLACLNFGSSTFPPLNPLPDLDHSSVLKSYAEEILSASSTNYSIQLWMLMHREGGEFPELWQAALEHRYRALILPIAHYLTSSGLVTGQAEPYAKMFAIMVFSEWNERATYNQKMLDDAQISRHAALVTNLFLNGLAAAGTPPGLEAATKHQPVEAKRQKRRSTASGSAR